jgi:hypothetical protein
MDSTKSLEGEGWEDGFQGMNFFCPFVPEVKITQMPRKPEAALCERIRKPHLSHKWERGDQAENGAATLPQVPCETTMWPQRPVC